MSVKTAFRKPLNIAECQIKGHTFPPDDVKSLFKLGITSLNSSCTRCNTPFKLLRRSNKTYRIKKTYSFREEG